MKVSSHLPYIEDRCRRALDIVVLRLLFFDRNSPLQYPSTMTKNRTKI
jgi:hypothetical protein